MPFADRPAGRIAAFSFVGVANTVTGVALIVASTAFGLGPVIANVVGYAGGLALSFTLNARVTFRGRSRDGGTVARFLGAFALAFALNLGVVALLAAPLARWPIVASLAGTPVYMACFFVLCDRWVFRGVAAPR